LFLPAPAAAQTTIDFDEFVVPNFRGPPFDGDTYLNLGVRFSTTGVGLFLAGARGLDATDTPPNEIYGSSETGNNFADRPVIATFVVPGTTTPTTVGSVSFFVSDGPGEVALERWTAQIFGLDGRSLQSQTGTDTLARVSFVRTQPDVARLIFTPSGDLESFDTLRFEVAEPASAALLGVAACLGLAGSRPLRRPRGWWRRRRRDGR
jgi:hypothetical protein